MLPVQWFILFMHKVIYNIRLTCKHLNNLNKIDKKNEIFKLIFSYNYMR